MRESPARVAGFPTLWISVFAFVGRIRGADPDAMKTDVRDVERVHEAAVAQRELTIVSFEQAVAAHGQGRGRGEIALHTQRARRHRRAADLYDQLAALLAAGHRAV